MIGDHSGNLLASFTGVPLAGLGLRFTPAGLNNLGEFLSTAGRELTYGKTALPYWNRVAQENNRIK